MAIIRSLLLLLLAVGLRAIAIFSRLISFLARTDCSIAQSLLLLGTPTTLFLADLLGAVGLIRSLRPRPEVFAATKAFSISHEELHA
jgi:hypothetical protein